MSVRSALMVSLGTNIPHATLHPPLQSFLFSNKPDYRQSTQRRITLPEPTALTLPGLSALTLLGPMCAQLARAATHRSGWLAPALVRPGLCGACPWVKMARFCVLSSRPLRRKLQDGGRSEAIAAIHRRSRGTYGQDIEIAQLETSDFIIKVR